MPIQRCFRNRLKRNLKSSITILLISLCFILVSCHILFIKTETDQGYSKRWPYRTHIIPVIPETRYRALKAENELSQLSTQRQFSTLRPGQSVVAENGASNEANPKPNAFHSHDSGSSPQYKVVPAEFEGHNIDPEEFTSVSPSNDKLIKQVFDKPKLKQVIGVSPSEQVIIDKSTKKDNSVSSGKQVGLSKRVVGDTPSNQVKIDNRVDEDKVTQQVNSDRLNEHSNNANPNEQGNVVDPTEESNGKVSDILKSVKLARAAGGKAWKELESLSEDVIQYSPPPYQITNTSCPRSIFMGMEEIKESKKYLKLPCGLSIGSSITIVAKPLQPHFEAKPTIGHISVDSNPVSTDVSQFIFELYGPKHAAYEEPSRILHVNPRLKGDWSDKPVIELNTYFKGQWGQGQRCDGNPSRHGFTVEGLPKCEKWLQGQESEKDPNLKYPFTSEQSFILTVRTGRDGFHMTVDGKHVSSFPHSAALLEEVAVGASIFGDVQVQAIIATSLPSEPPKESNIKVFEDWQRWKAPALQEGQKELFIGLLSVTDHFVERMAIRRSWFQAKPIQSGDVVARFFVALGPDQHVNLRMKKEAEYYGDMVIVPFMDDYNLVVFKTLEICDYGVNNVSAKYIMKSDDDSFIRVDAILGMLKRVPQSEELYMGNMNMYHKPLRSGKWAVTVKEWSLDVYPPYANGAGYIISKNIAKHVVKENKRSALELFKMEDVSMGLWVEQYKNNIGKVKYVDTKNFYQARCENNYVLAHYQSPRQMLCLHEKLLNGVLQCCN